MEGTSASLNGSEILSPTAHGLLVTAINNISQAVMITNTTANHEETFHTTINSQALQYYVKLLVYTIGFPVVVAFGLIGDSLNVFVIFRDQRLKSNLFYIFLRWLAVTDLAINVIFVPFMLIRATIIPYHIKSSMWYYTHVNFFLIRSLACSSSLLVTALTIDRYLSICHPVAVQGRRTHNLITAICASVVAFSFFVHIPSTYETVVVVVNETYVNWDWNRAVRQDNVFYISIWPIGKEIISKVIPIIVVSILNPLIIKRHRVILQRRRRLQQSHRSQKNAVSRAAEREDKNLLSILIALSVAFVVFTLPQAIQQTVVRHKPTIFGGVGFFVFSHVANIIEAMNFAANFYLYGIASSDYRKSFRNVVGCLFKTQVGTETTTNDGNVT